MWMILPKIGYDPTHGSIDALVAQASCLVPAQYAEFIVYYYPAILADNQLNGTTCD
jgi:hypothetical protein